MLSKIIFPRHEHTFNHQIKRLWIDLLATKVARFLTWKDNIIWASWLKAAYAPYENTKVSHNHASKSSQANSTFDTNTTLGIHCCTQDKIGGCNGTRHLILTASAYSRQAAKASHPSRPYHWNVTTAARQTSQLGSTCRKVQAHDSFLSRDKDDNGTWSPSSFLSMKLSLAKIPQQPRVNTEIVWSLKDEKTHDSLALARTRSQQHLHTRSEKEGRHLIYKPRQPPCSSKSQPHPLLPQHSTWRDVTWRFFSFARGPFTNPHPEAEINDRQ